MVTDDRVTARVLPDGEPRSWREFEVELGAHGEVDLLDRADTVLRKAGVRPSKSASKLAQALGPRLPRQPEPPGKNPTAGEVVLAYLRTQIAAIRRSDLEVRRDTDDAVHQLRVSARRARSVDRRSIFDASGSTRLDTFWALHTRTTPVSRSMP